MPKNSDKSKKDILLLQEMGSIPPIVAKVLRDHGSCKTSHRLQFEKLLRLIYCNHNNLSYPRFITSNDSLPLPNYYYDNSLITIRINDVGARTEVEINSCKQYLQMLKLKDLRFTMKYATGFKPVDRYDCLPTNDHTGRILSDDVCEPILIRGIQFTYSDLDKLPKLNWENNNYYSSQRAQKFWSDFLDDSIKGFLSGYLELLNGLSSDRSGKCNFKLSIHSIASPDCLWVANEWVERNLELFDTAWQQAEERYLEKLRMAGELKQLNGNNINRLNEFLLELNYDGQRREIQDVINTLSGVGVFLAEIQECPKVTTQSEEMETENRH